MCLNRKVFAHAKSIYEIEDLFYKKHGIKVLFIDLDNTLDSYKLFHPKQESIDLINSLKKNGFRVVIISNNKGFRVSSYANDLDVEYVSMAMKPFAKKINSFIETNNIDKNEVVLIGDQLVTDIGAANRANIKAILTEPIVKEDQWTTRFNRFFDKIFRKRMNKKGKLIDWRDK